MYGSDKLFELDYVASSKEVIRTYKKGDLDGDCVVGRSLKVAQVNKLKSKSRYKGIYPKCRLVGFVFAEKETFWFSFDDIKMKEPEKWDAYIKPLGPDPICEPGNGITDYVGSSSGSVVRGFCPH